MAHSLFNPLLITGFAGSTFLSGFLFALSYISIPTILMTPRLSEASIVTLWKHVYCRGFNVSPFTAVISGVISLTNAYLTGSTDRLRANRLVVAGLFMIGVVPFTLITISPTNRILMAREVNLQSTAEKMGGKTDVQEKGTMEDSRRLVQKWANLNLIRAMLPAAGALATLTAW